MQDLCVFFLNLTQMTITGRRRCLSKFELFCQKPPNKITCEGGAPILPDFPYGLHRVSLVSLLSKSSANRSTYYPSFFIVVVFLIYYDNCQKISEVFFCQNKVVVFCIFFRRNQRFDKIGMSIFMYLSCINVFQLF